MCLVIVRFNCKARALSYIQTDLPGQDNSHTIRASERASERERERACVDVSRQRVRTARPVPAKRAYEPVWVSMAHHGVSGRGVWGVLEPLVTLVAQENDRECASVQVCKCGRGMKSKA